MSCEMSHWLQRLSVSDVLMKKQGNEAEVEEIPLLSMPEN